MPMAPPERASGQGPARRRLVSLIVPAYNEEESAGGIVELFRTIQATYPAFDFELVVVDDGSADRTVPALLAALSAQDPARVVSLSRNFGSHAAITAGFVHSRGDCAMTLSADLQEPVEAIGRFLDAWDTGHEVVWGLRSTRAVAKGLSSWLAERFSVLLHAASEIPTYPKAGPSQVLVDRKVLDVLAAMPEQNRNVFGLVAWSGFRQTEIYFDQLPRPHGKSKWTRQKKIKLVLDSFVEFSQAPVRWIGYAGFLLFFLGVLVLLGTLVVALAQQAVPLGSAVVIAFLLALSGMQLVALQAIGEYVWRSGYDARRRPVYIVSDVHAPVAARQDAPTLIR